MPVIHLIAFRGTGGLQSPKYRHLPGLIKAGHVGIQLEDDPVIYGFHPSPAAQSALESEDEMLAKLIVGEPQQGALQDDTDVFRKAYDLSLRGERTTVWVLALEVADTDDDAILSAVREWYNNDKMTSKYSLPKRDGSFDPGIYNCAIFPKVLGVPIPSEDGRLAIYIEAMKAEGAVPWFPPLDNS